MVKDKADKAFKAYKQLFLPSAKAKSLLPAGSFGCQALNLESNLEPSPNGLYRIGGCTETSALSLRRLQTTIGISCGIHHLWAARSGHGGCLQLLHGFYSCNGICRAWQTLRAGVLPSNTLLLGSAALATALLGVRLLEHRVEVFDALMANRSTSVSLLYSENSVGMVSCNFSSSSRLKS